LRHRGDLDAARAAWHWPELAEFNWALDWFDHIGHGNQRVALRLGSTSGWSQATFDDLVRGSSQVANWFRSIGVGHGDPILVVLGNRKALWEVLLGAGKLGAVVVPTYRTVTAPELADRIERAGIRHAVVDADLAPGLTGVTAGLTRVSVGGPVPDWLDYADHSGADPRFIPDRPTRPDDPLFYYFTSGTTAKPKLVMHTQVSYPVGHLSGMYWNGLRPGDVHLNVSAPGWAKHAWSSYFVPWSAEATVVAVDTGVSADFLLNTLVEQQVTSICAPPSVWRQLVSRDLSAYPVRLREAASAGEPLDPDIVDRVWSHWGVAVRNGYGQTETTAQIGVPPDAKAPADSLGWPLPGYRIVLVDAVTGAPADQGEICVDLTDGPVAVMAGYLDGGSRRGPAATDGRYHTGDLAERQSDGQIRYLGRMDDMFKSFDYRISPLELETVLRGHDAVAQVAVVPVDDPIGGHVPKAYVVAAPGWAGDGVTAHALFTYVHSALPGEKQVRRVQFVAELPRTASGKIRRATLREGVPGQEYLDSAGRSGDTFADLDRR
jgi:acetyl-CoA synthetase